MAKSVRLKFKSDEGKRLSISMADPAPELLEEGGDVLAQSVVDTIIAEQPLNVYIAECVGVDVVERTVTEII